MAKKQSSASHSDTIAARASDPLSLVRQATPHLKIDRVQLLQGAFEVTGRSEDRSKEPVRTGLLINHSREDRQLTSRIKFVFDAVVPRKGEDRVVVVTATFELLYELKEGAEVSEEALGHFARINALYNGWPYWREFLQNTLARLDLPQLTVPLLRVQQAVAWAQEAETLEA